MESDSAFCLGFAGEKGPAIEIKWHMLQGKRA